MLLPLIEWSGIAANLLYVLFMMRRSMWAWPAGVAGCLLFGFWFGWQHYYASMGLNGIFFLQTLYGWWHWARTKNRPDTEKPEQPLRPLPPRAYLGGALAALVLTAAIYGLLRYTEAPQSPLMDAFLTALSILGYQLTIGRYLEHWLLWLVVDVLYTAMLAYNNTWTVAVVYAVFCILALRGYYQWRKAWKNQLAS